MRKILVLVPFPMTPEELANRQAQSKAVKLSPDIEIDYRPVRAAPRTYTSQQDYVLADMSLLEAGRSAQEDGYGAVCIDTVSDSGVSALRSVLDIPVIGPGRTMYTTALMLGRPFFDAFDVAGLVRPLQKSADRNEPDAQSCLDARHRCDPRQPQPARRQRREDLSAPARYAPRNASKKTAPT